MKAFPWEGQHLVSVSLKRWKLLKQFLKLDQDTTYVEPGLAME